MQNPPVPTAPGRLPGLGHALQFYRRPLDFMTSLAGVGEVVRVYLGTLPAYVLTTPDLVRQVLHGSGEDFDKGRLVDRMRPLLGDGLLSSGRELHRTQRRLVQPAFHRARIAQYAATMRGAADDLASSWKPGQTVTVDEAMTDLTLSVVSRTLFSAEPGSTISAEIYKALPVLVRGAVTRGVAPAWWLRLPLPSNRRFDDAVARIHTITDQVVRTRRTAAEQSDDAGDIVSMLLLARDADTGHAMNDQQIRDEVISLMLAGTETTQAALTWALYLTGTHPHIEERLHAELDTVLGGKSVTFEVLPRLEYTSRLISETLRMYPFWLLMRRALKPTVLGTVRLPAGAEIIYSPYLLHHDPRWFPEPERFDPDRWLPDRARALPRGAFVPFSAGPRKCIGDTFAVTEAAIALATITTRWTLRPLTGATAKPSATGPVIHPRRLLMTVQPRETHATAAGERHDVEP